MYCIESFKNRKGAEEKLIVMWQSCIATKHRSIPLKNMNFTTQLMFDVSLTFSFSIITFANKYHYLIRSLNKPPISD